MKNNSGFIFLYALASLLFFSSCQKDNQQIATNAQTAAATAQAASATNAIAVSASASADSIYIVNTCSRGSKLDSVALANLPSAISSYLSTTYSGYTFQKAFKVDSSGVLTGYVVVIQFNNNPVGLKFDASGNFIKVLEQREGRDLGEHEGWHHGGLFDSRGDTRKDSIGLSDLPAAIQSYFTTTYPGDTLIRAFKNRDSSVLLISTDNGLFATAFSSNGTFLQRMELPAHQGKHNYIAQDALPANVQTYLTATYPNYVFKEAFTVKQNGTLQGYVVMIDANNTKYAVSFDASGNFIKAVTVR